jgi:hypothetical protein
MSEKRSLSGATAIYTEDDTFRVLKQTPIQDIDPIYRSRFWEFYSDREGYLEWLEEHGWNDKDFIKAGHEYEGKLVSIYGG